MMRRAAIATLMLTAACSALGSQAIPQDVLDRCLATRGGDGDRPIPEFSLGDLIGTMTKTGGSARWETATDGGVIRLTKADQLRRTTDRIALEVLLSGPVADCDAGVSTIVRAQVNDIAGDGYQTQDLILGIVQAMHRERTRTQSNETTQ